MDRGLSYFGQKHERRQDGLDALSKSRRKNGPHLHRLQWRISAAWRELSWRHDTSKPHRPQSDGVAEQAVRCALEETRVVLLLSGMPVFWCHASKACSALRTAADEITDKKTPCFLRHTAHFGGLLVPHGVLVEYKPPPRKELNKINIFAR